VSRKVSQPQAFNSLGATYERVSDDDDIDFADSRHVGHDDLSRKGRKPGKKGRTGNHYNNEHGHLYF